MNTLIVRSVLEDRLGLRLILATVMISTLFSTIAAGIQLSFSYQRQRQDVTANFDQIEEALATPLEKALWKFDFDLVNVILDGIYANDVVAKLALSIPSGQSWERGQAAEFDFEEIYDLVHVDDKGQEIVVGRLSAFLTLNNVTNRIWAQFWTLLTSNLIKAYLSAFCMLMMFFFLVTKPLKEITTFIDHADVAFKNGDLKLSRKPKAMKDDLDHIVTALNQYRRSLAAKISDLHAEVMTRKKAEAQTQKAFEIRKAFLANMSHEVRTPLNAIMGLFQLIQMADVPERQKKQAEVGLKASHHLLAQLVNVLEISRMEADAIDIIPQPTEIRPLAEQWYETATATAHRLGKPIVVSLEIEKDTPKFCKLDARRVTQIVNNLTDNSLKFTENGYVTIGIALVGCPGNEDAERLKISVSDTGCGIATDQVETIFDRFVQVDNAETREHGGSGLGLAISRELANLMGATLCVERAASDGDYTTVFSLTVMLSERTEDRNVQD